MTENDPVDRPAHYRAGSPYETIRVLREWLPREQFIGFLRGNVIKYQSRLGVKAGADLAEEAGKARFYAAYLEAFFRETKEGITEGPSLTTVAETRSYDPLNLRPLEP